MRLPSSSNALKKKNAAFMRGDMDRWSSLARMAPDFTLMQLEAARRGRPAVITPDR
jgi:hypothetical protein